MPIQLQLDALKRIDAETFKKTPKHPIVLVLDNIRSMHNIGSVFRTADAFHLEAIHLCGMSAQPPHRDIEKTALGATQTVVWQYYAQTLDSLLDLRAQGYTLIAVEQTNSSVFLHQYQPKTEEKIALIFGNEVSGVSPLVLDAVDICLEVPQFGTKHSLNVSVCAGIVVWDLFCKQGT
jgi:23S rRNA (guanosine2251-2'-O)-methyltransferase